MREARYDAVADFYEAGWPDAYDDPASAALLGQVGEVDGLRVLDVACGHGRIARELARRGADVVGVDVSARLVAKAEAAERGRPSGVRYLLADVSAPDAPLPDASFDLAVCAFGLSDIDDLDGVLGVLARVVRAGGRFVFSILHPCFPGAGEVSGSWPAGGAYHDEGWWLPDGARSSLRRQVGANHRTLTTYVGALRRHGWWLDAIVEPAPPPEWVAARAEAARYPVFLVAACSRRDR